MKYDDIYISYMDYINRCRNIIKKSVFTMVDAKNLNLPKNVDGIDGIIKKHRLKMINIKYEHTMRMIEQIININKTLGFKMDLALVVKVAVLYHDIGRMRQAIWSNNFNDSMYLKNGMLFSNHGEDGYDIFLNNDFCVDKKYVPIIARTILYHQDHYTHPRLNYKFDCDLSTIRIDDVVTGMMELNENEWKIVALIVQLVADVDKMDILYQHLSDDFDMIREFVPDKSMDSLDNIANRWGISKKEIIEYNNISENNYTPEVIKIPIENVPIDKLEIPDYMKDMFYRSSWPELKFLIKDKNWNFISILWWRLSHFLNQIEFNSTLINVEESDLLNQIYNKIPEKIKPLVVEAFVYAKEVFVADKIERNKGNIYIRK